jgi:hypothetical protein
MIVLTSTTFLRPSLSPMRTKNTDPKKNPKSIKLPNIASLDLGAHKRWYLVIQLSRVN